MGEREERKRVSDRETGMEREKKRKREIVREQQQQQKKT
jgi:hypothetical protein